MLIFLVFPRFFRKKRGRNVIEQSSGVRAYDDDKLRRDRSVTAPEFRDGVSCHLNTTVKESSLKVIMSAPN
jgi:hypothetical protein